MSRPVVLGGCGRIRGLRTIRIWIVWRRRRKCEWENGDVAGRSPVGSQILTVRDKGDGYQSVCARNEWSCSSPAEGGSSPCGRVVGRWDRGAQMLLPGRACVECESGRQDSP